MPPLYQSPEISTRGKIIEVAADTDDIILWASINGRDSFQVGVNLTDLDARTLIEYLSAALRAREGEVRDANGPV